MAAMMLEAIANDKLKYMNCLEQVYIYVLYVFKNMYRDIYMYIFGV